MTVPQPTRHYTAEEYLAHERDARERHEFYRGKVSARSGGTPDHSLIISNINGELGNALKGRPGRVYESNLRVRVPRTSLYTYPDLTVICGERQFDPLDARRETVTNPTLVVEVLSPSTETWDRGGKFQNYQQIESLREYVLVSSDKPLVETFRRHDAAGGTWLYTAAAGPDARVALGSLGVELPLGEVYAGVEFPPDPTREGGDSPGR